MSKYLIFLVFLISSLNLYAFENAKRFNSVDLDYVLSNSSRANTFSFSFPEMNVLDQRNQSKQLSELFDDTLMVSEEYDLFLRLAYGKRCSYINGNPLTIYRMHNESLTYNNKLLFPEENKLILKSN